MTTVASIFDWDINSRDSYSVKMYLENMKWSVESWNADLTLIAAKNNHIEALKYLKSIGCQFDSKTCAYAAAGASLDALEWLLENGVVLSKYVTLEAATFGHLHIMKWAIANGCGWHPETAYWAAKNGHQEVLNWALENGCPKSAKFIKKYGNV
jgi:hypothetical protein